MNDKCVVFDLDDTLYKEIDFLKSGYLHILKQLKVENKDFICEKLVKKFRNGEDAFSYLIQLFPNINKAELLNWYRFHSPNISLSDSTISTLNYLKSRKIKLGIITNGRSLTQRNKIKALGLDLFIENPNIIISEEIGSEKPSENNYNLIVNANPDCLYYYIGDNIRNDFLTPKKLGWITIGIQDNGLNIHSPIPLPDNYQPHFWVKDVSEIIPILKLTE